MNTLINNQNNTHGVSSLRVMLMVLTFVLLSGVALNAVANEFYTFATAAQERQFNKLAGELRCPKCQNQTISDSDAPLAHDMRERVYQMIMEGKSNDEIIEFMKVRYGDFVHYRPPVNKTTIVLWLAPLAFLLLGALALWFNVRHQRSSSAELTAEEQERMNQVMKNAKQQAEEQNR